MRLLQHVPMTVLPRVDKMDRWRELRGSWSSPAAGAALLSISYALALFNRTAGAVLVVSLGASLHFGIGELAVIASVFFWVYAILQIPCGLLADIMGPRRLAVLGGLVTGVGSIFFASSNTIATLALSRGVIAAGCAVVFVSLMRHIRANWPERRVATISGRSIMIGNLGAIASAAPLSLLLLWLDWRAVWYAIGAISFSGAVILWFAMVDTHEPQHPGERIRNAGSELVAVVSNPYNAIGLLLLAGLAGTYYALASLWVVPMLTARGSAPGTAALDASLLIAGYAAGACVLGWIGDRTSRRATLSVACGCACACWWMLAADSLIHGAGLALLLFLLGFFSGAFNLVYALVTERNPMEHAGTATAFINVGIFLGAGAMQYISNALYAHSAGDYSQVMAPMGMGALMALLLSLTLYRPADGVALQRR